jgi:hypothetical protein
MQQLSAECVGPVVISLEMKTEAEAGWTVPTAAFAQDQ